MSEHESPGAIVRSIADDIGTRFGVTSAELGRRVADRLYAEADEETILTVLADGCATYLRRERTGQRRAVQHAIKQVGADQDTGEVTVQLALLDYPITLPGEQTMRLGDATKIDIRAALLAIESQRRGFDRTESQLQRFLDAMANASDSVTVASLIASGAIDVDELFGQEQAA